MIDILADKMIEYNKKQINVINQLDKVEQPYRNILDKIYIQGKDLMTVAGEMSYTYKYICKQHGIALEKFDKIEKEDEKSKL